ncbi:MAG: YdcF family protein [Anaerolineae bacterium]|nr:YdcF family protein [Anaerolineae bacterium]
MSHGSERVTNHRAATWRWGRRLIFVGIVLALVGMLLAGALAATIVRYGDVDRTRDADVIVVLGGGYAGTIRRTQHAVTLYQQGYAPYVLCAGGLRLHLGDTEAERCSRIAKEGGIPPEAILLENNSFSTEENAIHAAAVMRQRGWQTAVVVSDNYHLWRARWMFDEQDITVWTSPAQVTTGPLDRSEYVSGVLHELAAVGWYTAKTILRLPYTDFDL